VESERFDQRGLVDGVALLAAGGRTGVFVVTVKKPGFQDWIRTSVRVTGDECQPRTTELVARLERSS
jgi:hypothetical protein